MKLVVFCLLRPDDDEDEEQKANCPKISSFFGTAKTNGDGSKPAKRHRYFEERKLEAVDHFI